MKLSTLIHTLGIIVVGWIIYLFAKTIITHKEDFANIEWHFSFTWFILATLLLIIDFVLNAIGSQISLSLLGERSSFKQVLAMRLVSDIGRYLPGKIWKFAGRVHFSSKIHISKTVILVATFIEEIGNLVSAGIISLLALSTFKTLSVSRFSWIIAVIVIIIGVIFLYSSGMWNWLVNKGLRILNRPQLQIKWTFSIMTKLILLYSALWMLLGISFFCFIRAFTYVPINQAYGISILFVAAWLISYLSFLTPGGLGIREGLLALGLTIWLPQSYAIVIALSSRLWIMAAEGGLALWGWYILKRITPSSFIYT